ncbi:MAG: phenylalanine--tRNA ligase subunit beta [Oscillospiraceae bacterium]|nr:phenylalanine--tRNA ligase subunit beta [Oscillospiraceae bacterium]
MFISMNWICDFVDLSGLDKMKLIQQFSLSTAEVENEIFQKGSDIDGIVAATILSVEPHPESKKLHLLKVDAGGAEPVDVVCGAPNVAVGMKTAFAPVGARIGEITITPRKLAGCTSNGMCCSESEIGLSDDHSGIMVITDDIPNGTPLKDVYQIDDIVFEVDNKSLTNRPDLWGHYGIAREFSALSGRPLKEIGTVDLTPYKDLPKVDMKIEDPLCYRYACIQIDNVSRTVSPVNMRIRLFYCGMRAINFLADITNYIMLEMGQPMHAFDSRKVEKIRIKRFEKEFEFQTLDKEMRRIDSDTLMICNGDTPVAIAGIMGGLDSEIVADTTALTLESACFDPVSIRKSTVRLAHRTDASMRYEKSLDPEMVGTAVGRFLRLLTDNDPGVTVISAFTDEYAYHYPKIAFDFTRAFLDRYTGIEISDETVLNTLHALGFGAELSGDTFSVTVPSWRGTKDVTMKADIIEEVTRIYGYDNFAVHTAESPLYPVQISTEKNVEDQLKDLLVKRYSLHEVHSYVWPYYDEFKALGIPVEDNIGLLNSTVVIRRSIAPTQLCQIRINTAFAPEFGIFEIGRIADGVNAETNLVNEKKMLCITLFSKTRTTEQLYYYLKDMIAVLADDIKHLPVRFAKAEASHAWQHPKNLNTVYVNETAVGEIGLPYPTIAEKIDKKAAIVYAEIDVEKLAAIPRAEIVYDEPSKYPEMEVDLTFLAPVFAPIGDAVRKVSSPLIKKLSMTDIYEDAQGKAITVRLLFADKEKTLTREEVNEVVDSIINTLKAENIALKQ